MSKRRNDTRYALGLSAFLTREFAVALLVLLGIVGLYALAPWLPAYGTMIVGGVSFLAMILLGVAGNTRADRGRLHAALCPPALDLSVLGRSTPRSSLRLRCSYCHDSIAGEIYECAGCWAVYHSDCLEEARGCATLGCAHSTPRRTARL